MTCPKCDEPIDPEKQSCQKCRSTVGQANELGGTVDIPVSNKITKSKSCLRSFLIGLGVMAALIIVQIALLPWIASEMIHAPKKHVGRRGADIIVAINEANRSRTVSGLPSLWPRTVANTNHPGDFSTKIFQTSSDYFYELYDGVNAGTEQHKPSIKGFDYSNLAGSGVLLKAGMGKLQPENNMWAIAANITDEDDSRIPVLITRNIDVKGIERVVNQGLKKSEFNERVPFSDKFRQPFGYTGFVTVSKDGLAFCITGVKTRTLGELFGNKELPPRDPSKPPIVYLMP